MIDKTDGSCEESPSVRVSRYPVQRKDTSSSISSVGTDDSYEGDENPKKLSLPRVRVETIDGHDVSDSELTFYDASDIGFSGVSSDECRRDSGVELRATSPFVAPPDELVQEINEQVESYFADESIVKDAFLLKHVRRNKEGFVSLKLVSSFKRVKKVTKDWRQVAFAVEYSDKLELNDLKTKIRRLAPLPEFDETTPSRSVIAYDLPMEKPTINNVAELFKECGDIALVRVLRPGNPVTSEVRQFLNKRPDIAEGVSALVEFERSEQTRLALDLATEDGLKVVLMTSKSRKSSNKENRLDHPEEEKRKVKRGKKKNPRLYALRTDPDSSCFSGSEGETSPFISRRRSSAISTDLASLSSSPISSPIPIRQSNRFYPRGSPVSSPEVRRSSKGFLCSESPLQFSPSFSSPWVQRRMAAAKESLPSAVAVERRNSATNNSLAIPENVVRLPRGPDGSRGFGDPRPARKDSEDSLRKSSGERKYSSDSSRKFSDEMPPSPLVACC